MGRHRDKTPTNSPRPWRVARSSIIDRPARETRMYGLPRVAAILLLSSGCANEQQFRRIRTPPSVAIQSPEPLQEFRQGAGPLELSGTVVDTFDGPSRLSAAFVVDGGEPLPVEVGDDDRATLALDVDSLALGAHEIALVAVDSDGQEGSAAVEWTLLGALLPPDVLITAPLDGVVFFEGDEVSFRGQASDNNTDPDDLRFRWTSDLDGEIDGAITGGGESVAFTGSLSPGVHVVTLTVTDVDGLEGTDEVSLTVIEEVDPPQIVEAQVGDIVFSEILVNPQVVDDTLGEWIELFNTSGEVIDLDGYMFSDLDFDSYEIDDTILVEPGDYVVLCADMDPLVNGGVPCDGSFLRTELGGAGAVALGNAGDEVVLSRPDGVVIDQVVYTSTWFIPANAKGLDPLYLDADNNDDETMWCNQTSVIATGGEPGTPGQVNDPC